MGKGFGDFLSAQAVLLREIEMPGQLLHAPQRRQGGQGDQAAVARGERVTFPDIIEQDLPAQLGQLRRDAGQGFSSK